MPKRYSRVSEAQKTIFLSSYGMSLFGFLFIDKLGTCPQNFACMGGVEHGGKIHFPQWGILKFTYKGQFLAMKKTYENLLY
jgi:hypothetical protein